MFLHGSLSHCLACHSTSTAPWTPDGSGSARWSYTLCVPRFSNSRCSLRSGRSTACRSGRPEDRAAPVRSLLARAAFDISTIRALIDRTSSASVTLKSGATRKFLTICLNRVPGICTPHLGAGTAVPAGRKIPNRTRDHRQPGRHRPDDQAFGGAQSIMFGFFPDRCSRDSVGIMRETLYIRCCKRPTGLAGWSTLEALKMSCRHRPRRAGMACGGTWQ